MSSETCGNHQREYLLIGHTKGQGWWERDQGRVECGGAQTIATRVKWTSLPSFLMIKDGVRRSSSSTVPNLTTFKSWSPTFLTVAMTLISDGDATFSVGVERETSRPPTVRAVGVA